MAAESDSGDVTPRGVVEYGPSHAGGISGASSARESSKDGGGSPKAGEDAGALADREVTAVVPSLDHLTYVDYDAVYEPAEDTFLLLDALASKRRMLRALRPTIAVEIGPGSGVVSTYISQLLGRLAPFTLACDVNERACTATAATAAANLVTRVDTIASDLLSGLRQRLAGKIDLLLFNPPYVPTPSEEVGSDGIEAAWAGGEDGREVIDKVLPLLDDLLSPKGVMFMVVVAENKPEEIAARLGHAFTSTSVRATRARNEALEILLFERT